jgi:hypothetical protein
MAAPHFAVTDQFKKDLAAVNLSKVVHEALDFHQNARRQDFSSQTKTLLDGFNPDRRAIAIGIDPYLELWDSFDNPHPEWAAWTWSHGLLRRLLLSTATWSTALWAYTDPSYAVLDYLVDGTKDVTYVNNLEFAVFERFVKNDAVTSAQGLSYSVIDSQDILDGSHSGEYDFIEATIGSLMSPTMKYVDGYLDALAPGGTMMLTNTSGYRKVYIERFYSLHHYVRLQKHIQATSGIQVYHIPIDLGYTIIRKDA